ncbi:Possible hemagglutinin (DUF638) [Moraxella ovis]|uniref:Possible hemagglutinin (DUF638) n=1 Tax=Moraxella ovis TaxID=29433 RepID=A0A378PN74_9GAMM|nr:VENN motif pre-toxin domain-containing protein [Moraxella ovis]STY87907.1 Possible hemagglutinin (DUF638) [Moraxella ovis]
MVGDWLVTGELRQRFESGEIKPGSDDYNKVLNTARLTAGSIALLYDFDVDTAANEAGEAVENNALKQSDVNELIRLINATKRRGLSDAELDEKMRYFGSLAAKWANDNYQEILHCQNNPTTGCLNKIKHDYSNVKFNELKDVFHEYPEIQRSLTIYQSRNNHVVNCNSSYPADCIIIQGGIEVVHSGIASATGRVNRASFSSSRQTPQNNTNRIIDQNQILGNIISDAKKGRVTKGRTDQYEKDGGLLQANREFDLLELSNVRPINNLGRIGQMKDGTKVIVRNRSSDGRPTLEIQSQPRKIEIRYNTD